VRTFESPDNMFSRTVGSGARRLCAASIGRTLERSSAVARTQTCINNPRQIGSAQTFEALKSHGIRCFSSGTSGLKESYDHILVETCSDGGVGIITLNRPKALNALCDALFEVSRVPSACSPDFTGATRTTDTATTSNPHIRAVLPLVSCDLKRI
jgi:hypothetical protein